MTALYDATAVYLEDARARDGQHVLIMYTDGGDSSSTIGVGRLLELLRRSGNVIVYPIGYLENQQSTGRLEQRMRLGQMADATGGTAFFPEFDPGDERHLRENRRRAGVAVHPRIRPVESGDRRPVSEASDQGQAARPQGADGASPPRLLRGNALSRVCGGDAHEVTG